MSPPVLSTRRRWLITLVATLTMAISYLDRQTLAVLAPTVREHLHLSLVQYGWLASAFSFAYLISAPIAGRLVDIAGARRGLLAAVLLWSVVAALHAIVPSFGVLFLLRILLGIAESPSFPGAAQTVHRALPVAQRARGFGILFTGSSLGAAVASPLATNLAARFGWRSAFVGTAIVGLVWVPLWVFVSFEKSARRVLDSPADDGEATMLTDPPPALEVPVSTLALLRRPAVIRGLVAIMATAPIAAFAFLWGSQYMVSELHMTQLEVGSYLWVPPVLFDVSSLLFGDLASRHAKNAVGRRRTPRLLFGTATALIVALALLPLTRDGVTTVVLIGVALSGNAGAFALLTGDMLGRVPPKAVSAAGGMCAAAQSLAYIVANPLIGWGANRFGGYTFVVTALVLWALPGCLLWIFWNPSRSGVRP